jgi:hypothetical protein
LYMHTRNRFMNLFALSRFRSGSNPSVGSLSREIWSYTRPYWIYQSHFRRKGY